MTTLRLTESSNFRVDLKEHKYARERSFERFDENLSRACFSLKSLGRIERGTVEHQELASISKAVEKIETISKGAIYRRLKSLFFDIENLPNIIILGKPGGGKGSLCKLLSKQYSYVHLSIGDIHRGENEAGTELGLRIRACVAKKDFFGSEMIEITRILLDKRFEEITQRKQRFILDNFPTSVSYLPYMQEVLERYQLHGRVILIVPELSDHEATERLSSRVVCSNQQCASIYSLREKAFAPEMSGFCDDCGLQLKERIDDRSETPQDKRKLYQSKFDIYQKHIYPVIESISHAGKIESFLIDSSDLRNLFLQQTKPKKESQSIYLKYGLYCTPIIFAVGAIIYKSRI